MSTRFNVASIDAIAKRIILDHATERQINDRNCGGDHDAAGAAYAVISYGDEILDFIGRPHEREKFRADDDSDKPWGAPNQIAAELAFELGFKFAMRLTARIIEDPLGDLDITDLRDAATAEMLALVETAREDFLIERGRSGKAAHG